MAGKQYRGTTEEFEAKLARVMARLGVDEDHYQSNWTSGKGGASCWVEMQYAGSVYRFENSTEKSRQCGRDLVYVSDLFGAVVYALEGLARAVEQGIFTLDICRRRTARYTKRQRKASRGNTPCGTRRRSGPPPPWAA